MSLINDALKRAKQAQAQTSPSAAAGPALRPVEPASDTRKSFGVVLPAFFIIVIGAGLFLLWGRFHAVTRAEPKSTVLNNTQAPSVRDAAIVQPVKTTTPPQQPVTEAISKEVVETVVFGPASGGQSVGSEAKAILPDKQSATPPLEKPPATAASPLKLTGIVFHPSHPAAMIGGKMLFLNDKVGEWRVVAINRESATLSNAGQTNVLKLAQ